MTPLDLENMPRYELEHFIDLAIQKLDAMAGDPDFEDGDTDMDDGDVDFGDGVLRGGAGL